MNKIKRILMVVFIIIGLHTLSGFVSEAIATAGAQGPKPQKRVPQTVEHQNRL